MLHSKYILKWFEVHAASHCNLSCKNCVTSSPFFKKTQYQPEDYFPWIDLMLDRNIQLFRMGIIGGEPFLHSDLPLFVKKFTERYNLEYVLHTNGHWISDENISKYKEMLSSLRWLSITLYQPVIEKLGGIEATNDLLDKIRKITEVMLFPRGEPAAKSFAVMEFTKTPLKDEELHPCEFDGCVCLTSDGLLTKCPPAAYSDKNPLVTKEFLENRGNLLFDLKNQWSAKDLKKWGNREFPYDGCRFCTLAMPNYRDKWESDPSIRILN